TRRSSDWRILSRGSLRLPGVTLIAVTGIPATAHTSTMPRPIMPQPTTATLLTPMKRSSSAAGVRFEGSGALGGVSHMDDVVNRYRTSPLLHATVQQFDF